MRHLIVIATLSVSQTVNTNGAGLSSHKNYEQQLEDVMEIIDTTLLKSKLKEVENASLTDPSELNRVRLGLIYHEVALNLSFFSSSTYKGYAQKSFDTLSVLMDSGTSAGLKPYIASYRASALSLVSAETNNLKKLSEAFRLFDEAVNKYAEVSCLPQFLRGSVAENLPWFFFSKRKYAKSDFTSIIAKQERDPDYAGAKIMSFTYWAWANQHRGRKDRKQAIAYLDKAIQLDPDYKGGRKKAEELKVRLQ